MSRMSAPKMEVVRFTQSDVIVASGAVTPTLTLSGFNDSTRANGSITFTTSAGSTTYGSTQFNDNGILAAII